MDRELTKSEDARTARSGSRCTRLVERGTPRTVRCAAFFVRSENSSALVGDGLLRFELCGQLRVHNPVPANTRYIADLADFVGPNQPQNSRTLSLSQNSLARFRARKNDFPRWSVLLQPGN